MIIIFISFLLICFLYYLIYPFIENKSLSFSKKYKLYAWTPRTLIIFLAISFILITWWFFPTKDDICYRFLDGRYTEKKAVSKWIARGGRYGSENGLIDNCRKYIPYIDPDKLIFNR